MIAIFLLASFFHLYLVSSLSHFLLRDPTHRHLCWEGPFFRPCSPQSLLQLKEVFGKYQLVLPNRQIDERCILSIKQRNDEPAIALGNCLSSASRGWALTYTSPSLYPDTFLVRVSIHSEYLCIARDGSNVRHVKCPASASDSVLLEYKEFARRDLDIFEELQQLRYSDGSDIDGGCALHSSVDSSLLSRFPVDCSDAIGRTPLMSATLRGSARDVELLLLQGANCLSSDISGVTAVWLAAAYHQKNALEVLLRFPQCFPSISRSRSDGVTPLLAACSKHIDSDNRNSSVRSAVVRMLVASGVSEVDASDIDGVTALIACSEANDTVSASLLLSEKANPNAMTTSGFTALMFAASVGSLSLTRELLLHGAEPNHRPLEGPTSLMYASSAGHCEVVNALLGAGADASLEHIDSDGSSTSALREASANGHFCAVDMLLFVANTSQLRSALFAAVREGHSKIVRLLFGAISDIDWREMTSEGKTLLHLAAAAADGPSVTLFLQSASIDPSRLDVDGFTAMFYAIRSDCSDCVAALLQYDPPNSLSLSSNVIYRNVGAFELAMREGSDSVADLLLQRRLVHWNDTMSNNMTALHFAFRYANPDTAIRLALYDEALWAIGDTSAIFAAAISRGSDKLLYWLETFAVHNRDLCLLLWSAVTSGNINRVLVIRILSFNLISGQAPRDCSDEDGSTPLMLTAYHGQMSAVSMILAMEFDPLLRNSDGHDAASFARAGKAQVEELLANFCPQLCFLGNSGNGLTVDRVYARLEQYDEIIETLSAASVNQENRTHNATREKNSNKSAPKCTCI